MLKIGGSSWTQGYGLTFRDYLQPSRDRRLERIAAEAQGPSLKDLKLTHQGLSELRQAFEYLQKIEGPSQSPRARSVAGLSAGGPFPPQGVTTDYRIKVTSPSQSNELISLSDAEAVTLDTKAARLREREDIGSTNDDRSSHSLTISLLKDMSQAQLESQLTDAEAKITDWHSASLTGAAIAHTRSELSRALFTVDYMRGGHTLGTSSEDLAISLTDSAKPGAVITDGAIQSSAESEISNLTRDALAQRFGEVVQALEDFDTDTLPDDPPLIITPTTNDARDQLIYDLQVYESIKDRMATPISYEGTSAEKVRYGFALGSRASDITSRATADASLDGLTRGELEALDAAAEVTLSEGVDLLSGEGTDPSAIDRDDLIYALRIKERLAGNEAPTLTVLTPTSTQGDLDTESMITGGSPTQATITLTGDPDAPDGFTLSFDLPNSLELDVTVGEIKARHETLGLVSPLEVGAFTLLGEAFSLSESDTLNDLTQRVSTGLQAVGYDMDLSGGGITITGALDGSSEDIDFTQDTTGFFSLLGLQGLSIDLEAVSEGSVEDHRPFKRTGGANLSSKKKGIKKLDLALASFTRGLKVRGVGSELAQALEALSDTLLEGGAPGLKGIGDGLKALSGSQEFVDVMEGLMGGADIQDVAALLNTRSEEGGGDVKEVLLAQITALESILERLVDR